MELLPHILLLLPSVSKVWGKREMRQEMVIFHHEEEAKTSSVAGDKVAYTHTHTHTHFCSPVLFLLLSLLSTRSRLDIIWKTLSPWVLADL